jgi:hypothetical protein
LAIVGVAFAGPLVLLHSAAGTRRRRNRFPQTTALLFLRFQWGLELSGLYHKHYIGSAADYGCVGESLRVTSDR